MGMAGDPRLPHQLQMDQDQRKTFLWALHKSTRNAQTEI